MTHHHYPMPHGRYSATPREAQDHYARGGAVHPSSQTKLRLTEGGGLRAEGCISGLVGWGEIGKNKLILIEVEGNGREILHIFLWILQFD